jgi:hypothetical protein
MAAKRSWVLVVPPLDICRKNFEELVKREVNWDEDEDENELF